MFGVLVQCVLRQAQTNNRDPKLYRMSVMLSSIDE